MDIFKDKTIEMPAQDNVKSAQSVNEAQQLLRNAAAGDFNARSIEHVERPRYGHKV